MSRNRARLVCCLKILVEKARLIYIIAQEISG